MAFPNFQFSKNRISPLLKTAESLAQLQRNQLIALLRQAQNTAFGRYYGFREMLLANDPARAFRRQVPATDYNGIYQNWWSRAHQCDEPNVTWPGLTPYYALSSGTSQAATKHIPVNQEMLRAMKKASRRMFLDAFQLPEMPLRQFARKMLMVGSCTNIKPEGRHHTGDLSGIIAANRPLWLDPYYLPGRAISQMPDWSQRIEAIAENAPRWDVGFVVGNPAWVQMIFERILEKYGARHIHEIWRNLDLFVHGGVFFEPYRAGFEQLLGREIVTLDSYMASEGFFAYQNRPGNPGMKLLPDCGVYFEFVPFDEENFDENGDLKKANPTVFDLENVCPGKNYALLLSTCAGAWRYLLGDTVQFTDPARAEIRLTGRTKQFLSVCGEHLSIDNLNEAVRRTDRRLRAGVREFSVAALPLGSNWMHQWWVSLENPAISPEAFALLLDEELCRLNDDYRIEREYALQDVRVEFLPNEIFFDWLRRKGKLNGQAKIPRVLKGAQLADFQAFLQTAMV